MRIDPAVNQQLMRIGRRLVTPPGLGFDPLGVIRNCGLMVVEMLSVEGTALFAG